MVKKLGVLLSYCSYNYGGGGGGVGNICFYNVKSP